MSDGKVYEPLEVAIIKHNKDYNLPTKEDLMRVRNMAKETQQLQATNQELLSALEWIVSEIKDCAQPEDWESFDACEKAINNAKQVMGDSDDNS